MLKRALSFMRERPARVLWLKARNALHLFNPQLLPRYAKAAATFATVESGRVRLFNERQRPLFKDVSHAAARSALILLAGIGLALRGIRVADAPLLIVLAVGAAVCVVFFPTTRLMTPVMFVVMYYAAVGIERLLGARATSEAARPRP
jgi:hypothetical protein